MGGYNGKDPKIVLVVDTFITYDIGCSWYYFGTFFKSSLNVIFLMNPPLIEDFFVDQCRFLNN